MDVIINQDMNIYVNNKLADMDTKVYENFSVVWTMEELQLSDRDKYENDKTDADSEQSQEHSDYQTEDEDAYRSDDQTEDEDAYRSDDQTEDEDALRSDGQTEDDSYREEEDAESEYDENNDAETDEQERAPYESDPKTEAQNAVQKGVSIHVTVNQKPVSLSGKSEYVFVDVFQYIEFDLSKPQGSGIVTKLNGRDAQYMENIHNGDIIEIYWKH